VCGKLAQKGSARRPVVGRLLGSLVRDAAALLSVAESAPNQFAIINDDSAGRQQTRVAPSSSRMEDEAFVDLSIGRHD
jgi:hypothetical protein